MRDCTSAKVMLEIVPDILNEHETNRRPPRWRMGGRAAG